MRTNFLSSSSPLHLPVNGNAWKTATHTANSPTGFSHKLASPLREKSSPRCNINVFSSKRSTGDDHDRNSPSNSSSPGGGGSGRLVDEDMIVLRLRVKELSLQEERSSSEGASDWMGWEKQYYDKRFHHDVYAAVGFLQYLLMNSRPSFALAMAALVSVSVPTTVGVVLFHGLRMVASGMTK